ncbi:MAG: helix-hairpin-helix domain-containing protein [Actinobacteria bacterium]|nr:helix-hairpin-helix domain-containing protein [Actinomycetota bacterium]
MELIKKKANYYLDIVKDAAKSKFYNFKNLTYEKWQILAVIFLAIVMIITGVYLYFNSKPKLLVPIDNSQNNQNLSSIYKNQNEIENNGSEENKYDNNFSGENDGDRLDNLKIVVHVCGEVKYPGVYYLQNGQRIYDAIQKAGGSTEEADIHLLNLAQILSDEARIYVPKKGEVVSSDSFYSDSMLNQKININNADSATLQKLSGIGPTLAQRIIDYRKNIGRFKSIEQLLNVKGIGPSKFEEIKDKVQI